MSEPTHPQQQPYYGQPMQPQRQRSVAGSTLKVLFTIFAVLFGLGVVAVIGVLVLFQLT